MKKLTMMINVTDSRYFTTFFVFLPLRTNKFGIICKLCWCGLPYTW